MPHQESLGLFTYSAPVLCSLLALLSRDNLNLAIGTVTVDTLASLSLACYNRSTHGGPTAQRSVGVGSGTALRLEQGLNPGTCRFVRCYHKPPVFFCLALCDLPTDQESTRHMIGTFSVYKQQVSHWPKSPSASDDIHGGCVPLKEPVKSRGFDIAHILLLPSHHGHEQ